MSKNGYQVTLICPHRRDETVDGVKICAVSRSQNRIMRVFCTTTLIFIQAVKYRADLYHFHDPELLAVGLILKAFGKRVIYDIHEDLPRALFAGSRDYVPSILKRPASWLIERFENLAVSKLTALIAATPAIGNRFKPLHPNTEVINNYPVLEELTPQNPVSWDNRPFDVAYVGGMSFERGLREMIEAISLVPERLNARLKLAGDFSLQKNSGTVFSLPGWARTDILGFVDRRKVANLLSETRAGLIVFHPDPNHVQAQPNKLFEYMSAGVPVIASDFPLWRKIVENIGCGLLVDPLNPGEIADAIQYLLTHPAEAEEMGIRGREAVNKYFNWDTEKDKLLRLYEDVLRS